MPDLVGKQLDVAMSDLERAGVENEDDVEVLGGGVFGVVMESNWTVCSQEPASGSPIGDQPRLTVDRDCGTSDGTSDEPSDEPSEEVDPTEEVESAEPEPEPEPEDETDSGESEEVLTTRNSDDLATLLKGTDTCDNSIKNFAQEYEGRTLRFDGNIATMNNSGDYDTRYDILIYGGDYSETVAVGPSFQFRDVGISDLNLTGPDIPDQIGTGDNLDITATVDTYIGQQCLFLLEPVETRFR